MVSTSYAPFDKTITVRHGIEEVSTLLTAWAGLNNITLTGELGMAPKRIIGTKKYIGHRLFTMRGFIISIIIGLALAFLFITLVSILIGSAIATSTPIEATTGVLAVAPAIYYSNRKDFYKRQQVVQFQITAVPTPLIESSTTIRIWVTRDGSDVQATIASFLNIVEQSNREP